MEDTDKVVLKGNILGLFRKYLFTLKGLSENTADKDPFKQFEKWFKDAIKAEISLYEAMTLSTVSEGGKPSSRVVLLKEFDENGFVFYTNYQSRKAKEMEKTPSVALSFFWPSLNRQVRIEGSVEKIDTECSDAYFNSRPRGSRIGAWASPQSEEISDRSFLAHEEKRYKDKFASGNIPRPPHWGGYCVKPVYIEFWQARADRLHDRILYKLQEDMTWKIHRLAP